jgi:hypothetical protein
VCGMGYSETKGWENWNWWDGPPGEDIRRQVSVETHGSGIGAVLCAVRVLDLLNELELREPMEAVRRVKLGCDNL